LNDKTFDELLVIEYGAIGTVDRNEFEEQAQYFVISEMLKQARKEANLIQVRIVTKPTPKPN